jgi:hypothetical protein
VSRISLNKPLASAIGYLTLIVMPFQPARVSTRRSCPRQAVHTKSPPLVIMPQSTAWGWVQCLASRPEPGRAAGARPRLAHCAELRPATEGLQAPTGSSSRRCDDAPTTAERSLLLDSRRSHAATCHRGTQRSTPPRPIEQRAHFVYRPAGHGGPSYDAKVQIVSHVSRQLAPEGEVVGGAARNAKKALHLCRVVGEAAQHAILPPRRLVGEELA